MSKKDVEINEEETKNSKSDFKKLPKALKKISEHKNTD